MNEQENIIETFSEMAPRYETLMNSELNRFWGINYPDFVNELISKFNFENDQNILDLATGTAFIPQTVSMKGILFKQFVGLDITLDMLLNAKDQIKQKKIESPIRLVCASAHDLPFKQGTFNIITCCLATHHMNVDQLLDQAYVTLTPGGKFHIADVGGSKSWRVGFIQAFIKVVGFLYFFFTENFSRARAEATAVPNILSNEEWEKRISMHKFVSVKTREIQSKYFWFPNPVFIIAKKPMEE